MKRTRRQFLQTAATALAAPSLSRHAHAQAYPARPVKMIVPYAPGGPTDVAARLIAQKLSDSLGKQFYVENVGGAGGNIGTGQAAKAMPDGYTILIAVNSHVINPTLYEHVPYDPYKDFDPVTLAVAFSSAFFDPSVGAREQREGVRRLRKGQHWQAEFRIIRRGDAVTSSRRAIPHHAGSRSCSRAIPRQRSRHRRGCRQSHADRFRRAVVGGAVRQGREAARARGHEQEAFAGAAGCADDRRGRLSRHGRRRLGRRAHARARAEGDRVDAQSRDQPDHRDSPTSRSGCPRSVSILSAPRPTNFSRR